MQCSASSSLDAIRFGSKRGGMHDNDPTVSRFIIFSTVPARNRAGSESIHLDVVCERGSDAGGLLSCCDVTASPLPASSRRFQNGFWRSSWPTSGGLPGLELEESFLSA